MVRAAIEIDNVSKSFRLYRERNQSLKAAVLRGKRTSYDRFWALRGVSMSVPAGSTFGIIGANGSGKSTLLKCVSRILLPDTGSVRTRGSMVSLLELGSGFHPELTGRENIYLNASMLRISRGDIEAKLHDILDFADIGDFIDQPVKNYSTGMYVRLGFAVAINVDPDVLLVDEVLAVGDASFQDKCMEKFADFRRLGKTLLLASHAVGAMQTMCDEICHLDHGRLVAVGVPAIVVGGYLDAQRPQVVVREEAPAPAAAPAHIVSVEVLDSAGYAVSHVQTGDLVTIRVHYLAAEPVDKPVFSLVLDTISGMRVWAHHSRDEAFVPKHILGAGSVDLTVPRLLLQRGSYNLHASIIDDGLVHIYDLLPQSFRLEVSNDSLNESAGVAVLGGSWSHSSHEQPIGQYRRESV